MVSMKNDPAKAEDQKDECASLMSDPPAYPWGLRIRLEEDQLDKLGMAAMPAVGSKVRVMAMAEVVSVNQNQEQGGEVCRCVELQITDMDPPSAGAKFYDKSNMQP